MNRWSLREWTPIFPWPRCPLAGQCTLGQNTVVGSMTVLLALLRNMPRRVCLDPHFCYKLPGPRFGGELPRPPTQSVRGGPVAGAFHGGGRGIPVLGVRYPKVQWQVV